MNLMVLFFDQSWYLWKRNNWMLDPRFYFYSYRDISIDRPIFLIGNQGDGLTLVSRILRRHPDVISVTGNCNYWSGADEMQNVFGPALPAKLTGIRYKAPKHPILTPPRSWSYATDELLPAYRKTEEDANEELARSLKRIIRYLIGRYSLTRDQPARFVDKSQVFTVRVSLINELLKEHDPKFVLITRNPYASCYRAALGKAGDMKRYKKILPFEERLKLCAQHWSNSMKCVLEDEGRIDKKILHVRFEDLLAHPTENIKRICEFVELGFDEDMLPHPEHKIPLGTKYRDRWYPMRPGVNDQYLKRLDRKAIEIIDDRCGELAMKFGYQKPRVRG